MAINWREYVRSQLPPLPVAAEREIEIVDELASQLESSYERARANGASDDEARRLAMSEVPDWRAFARTVTSVERSIAPPPSIGAPGGGIMIGFLQDVRYAIRALRRAPGFAAVSIITLALGIAATTIVYSIADGILLRPLPIRDPDRVLMARETFGNTPGSVAWPNFEDWQKRQTSFEQLAAWRGLASNLTSVDNPRRLNTRQMTWNMLSVLGVTPALGRDFSRDDDQPGVPRTAIVSYGFWQSQLGGSADAIGKSIMVDETPVTVIGVLPQHFTIARQEDLLMPLGNFFESGSSFFARGNHLGLTAVGRLKNGVSLETARAEITAIARQLAQEYPATNSGTGVIVMPFFEVLVGDARPMLYILLAAVAIILLLACVNLANLLLSRAAGRAAEMAVRRSLGAARWRIARQLLTESVLLSIVGGVFGIVLAYAGFAGILALLPPNQPRIHTITIDARVLAVSALASIVTGILFGLVPALQAATGRSLLLLRGARVTNASQVGRTTRQLLMLAEVALAVVLVTGAGLMLRTMSNLLNVDTGFDRAQIVSAQFALPPRYDPERRVVFMNQVIEKLKMLPGVRAAAFTQSLPVAGSNWNSVFTIEGQPVPERSKIPSMAWTPVTPEYFDTIGIRLRKGRAFSSADSTNAPKVIVVNETFARRMFGSNDPIGARVKQSWPEDKTPWREIVGIVNDVRVSGLQDDPPMQAYVPFAQTPSGFGAFVIRATGTTTALGAAMQAAVHEVEPNLPLNSIQSMDDVVDAAVGNERLTTALLFGFASLALIIAAIGVFGVTAYSVAQRTHELGIRMALGANRGSVLGLVLRQEMSACLIGIAIGSAGAFFLASVLQSLLFGVSPRDSATLAIAAVVLLTVTLIACLLPALRATRVDPVTALRIE